MPCHVISHDPTLGIPALGLFLSFNISENVARNSAIDKNRGTRYVAMGNTSNGRLGRGGIPCSLQA